jgi:hypothetical protein
MLKPQDIVVLLKLVVLRGEPWTLASLAKSLHMSVSEVHGALSRAANAGLYRPSARRPVRAALEEFLTHGLRYAFAAERLGMSRGVPTAHSAPGVESVLTAPDIPFVWPDPVGDVRGEGIKPLFRTVPRAAREDPHLYRLLALSDAARIGGARERRITAELLQREMKK